MCILSHGRTIWIYKYKARKTQCKRLRLDLIISGISIDITIIVAVTIPITRTLTYAYIFTTASFLFNCRIDRIQPGLRHIELACVLAALCKRNTSVLTLLRIMSYMPRIVSFNTLSWPTTRRPTSTAVLGLCLKPCLLAVRTKASTSQVYCLTRATSMIDAVVRSLSYVNCYCEFMKATEFTYILHGSNLSTIL